MGGFPRLDQESGRGTMDVIDVSWRKSSYSGDNGGACVEVGTAGRIVAVRDGKDRKGHGYLLPRTRGRRSPRTLRQAPDPGFPSTSSRSAGSSPCRVSLLPIGES